MRLLPLAAGQTFDDGVEFLLEAFLTVVPHQGMGLVTQTLLAKHLGVGNLGGLATRRYARGENTEDLKEDSTDSTQM